VSDHYYILGGEYGKTPVPCDLMTWATAFERRENRRVAFDALPGGVSVSTVFLGLDHQFGGGPPLLFETMIFGGPQNDYQERCSTWGEALVQHAKAVAVAKSEESK
jgi:hypothetical protein